MRNVQFIAALLAVVIVSCDRDEDPTPKGLVTYTLEVDQQWSIFANGPDGRLLDSKQLVFGQPVTLSVANPPDSFSLTLVRVFQTNPPVLDITTYTGIKPGSSFTPKMYTPAEFTPVQESGKAKVNITKYPIHQSLPLVVGDPYQYQLYYSDGQATVPFSLSVWETEAPPYLATGYNGDFLHPVYKYIDPVNVGATATADFTTFAPFPKTLDLEPFDTPVTAQVQFDMYSLTASNYVAYKFADVGWTYSGISPTIRVGYLDQVSNYYIDMTVYEYEESTQKVLKQLSFTNMGPMPSTIEFPDDDFTLRDESKEAFDFEFDGTYQVKSQSYSLENGDSRVQWSVFSGVGDSMPVADMPPELLSQFPGLDLQGVPYVSTTFYYYPDGYSYGDFRSDRFTTTFAPEHPGYAQTFMK